MKTTTCLWMALLIGISAFSSCNKSDLIKPVYDNSQSFVSWSLSPLSNIIDGNAVVSPPLITGWSFNPQYDAFRVLPDNGTSPFYGYPTGAFILNGQLSFDYGSDMLNSQTVSLFFNSDTAVTGTGTYSVTAALCGGYMARITENGTAKNLYFTGNKQILTIDGYHTGYRMCDNTSVTVISGLFQLYVADISGGSIGYTISGRFQFPVPNRS